ncbi:unnamed protein product [Closterium sp. Naga37s-1]|nr:unnamed protein product [Closterium sp. Naga37s-1]
MTPKLLRNQLRDKFVLVIGDSVAKNFAASVMCVLHSSSWNQTERFQFENRGSVAHGMQIPRYNIRVASVTSNFLSNATALPSTSSTPSPYFGSRVNLDQLQDDILNLMPLADLVVFEATNWWTSRANKFFIGDTELSTVSVTDAYEIALQTLKSFVERAQERAFKGTAVLLGASPTHYELPLPGVPGGSCQVNQKLTWLQAQEIRQGDTSMEGFREVERRVLSGSPIRYLDVGPMSDSRPDGHIQNWMDPGGDSTFTSPKAGAVGVKRLQEGAAPGTYFGPKIDNGKPITVEFDLGSDTITVESREGENLLHLAERCGAMKASEEFCFEGTCCHCEMEVEGGASEAGYRAMGGSDLIRSCICPVPGRNGGTLKVRILSEEDVWGDGVLPSASPPLFTTSASPFTAAAAAAAGAGGVGGAADGPSAAGAAGAPGAADAAVLLGQSLTG